jgi:hypothetical protein
LRVIQHVVDDRHQVVGRLAGVGQDFLRTRFVVHAFYQQAVEAQDRIHGCTQLVADRGNEVLTQFECLLQLLLFFLQLLLPQAAFAQGRPVLSVVHQGHQDQHHGDHGKGGESVAALCIVAGQRLQQPALTGQDRNPHLRHKHHAQPQIAGTGTNDVEGNHWQDQQPGQARRKQSARSPRRVNQVDHADQTDQMNRLTQVHATADQHHLQHHGQAKAYRGHGGLVVGVDQRKSQQDDGQQGLK